MKQSFKHLAFVAMGAALLMAACGKDDDKNDNPGGEPGTMCTITVAANNDAWGTVTGGGTYAVGTSVTISATAHEGYRFDGWTDGPVGSPRTVTVSGNATYTAIFARQDDPVPQPQPTVEWVDLGLPSGLLWASHNVGATSPEDFGDYFAWAETAPKSTYTQENYAYYGNVESYTGEHTLIKYCTYNEFGPVDGLTTLEAMDDAATVNWGGGSRTPTPTEWDELIQGTTADYVQVNGVWGHRFTGHNGNSIFLPAGGWKDDKLERADDGWYWSNSLYAERLPFKASCCHLTYSDSLSLQEYGLKNRADLDRTYGCSVRPVRSAQP